MGRLAPLAFDIDVLRSYTFLIHLRWKNIASVAKFYAGRLVLLPRYIGVIVSSVKCFIIPVPGQLGLSR